MQIFTHLQISQLSKKVYRRRTLSYVLSYANWKRGLRILKKIQTSTMRRNDSSLPTRSRHNETSRNFQISSAVLKRHQLVFVQHLPVSLGVKLAKVMRNDAGEFDSISLFLTNCGKLILISPAIYQCFCFLPVCYQFCHNWPSCS